MGPGAYNTLEEERIKQKYIAKYDKLFTGASLKAGRGIVRVGKNLSKATERVPEYEETQKKLKDQLHQKVKLFGGDLPKESGTIEPGPGTYGKIRDWRIDSKRRSFNLKHF